MEEAIPTPAVFAGSLARTFEYRTRGVHATPHVRWTFTTPGATSCPVLVDQGVVYVADGLGSFSAIETNSGTLLWRFQTEGLVIITFCLAGALSYVLDEMGSLYEVDGKTGQSRRSWKHLFEKYEGQALFFYDGLLFLGSQAGGDICRFDPSVGQVSPDGIPIDIYECESVSPPCVYRGVDGETDIIFGFSEVNNWGDIAFQAINLSPYGKLYPQTEIAHAGFEPELLWYTYGDDDEEGEDNRVRQVGVILSEGTILDNVLYAFSHYGSDPEDPEEEASFAALVALNPRTGDVLWRYKYENDEVVHQIAAASSLVFLRFQNHIEALDVQSRQPCWNYQPATIPLHLFVADSLLYVFEAQAQLTALDIHTGEERWTWLLEGEMLEQWQGWIFRQMDFSTIADGTLYVVAGNTLCALS